MLGEMPASAREDEKGAIACAVAAVCPDRGCSRALLSQRQSWLDMCPSFQAGLTGRHRTSRRPLAQNFENESSFQFFIVSGPIEMYSEFDLFSREVSVATRTIPSLPL